MDNELKILMDNSPRTGFVRPAMPMKVVYTVIAVVLLMIGVLGLIIPIIPGILFLIGAVLLLAKVSSRVHHWSEGQAWVRGARIRMIEMQGLRPVAKIRFAGLLAARSVVRGVQSVNSSIQKFRSRAQF